MYEVGVDAKSKPYHGRHDLKSSPNLSEQSLTHGDSWRGEAYDGHGKELQLEVLSQL